MDAAKKGSMCHVSKTQKDVIQEDDEEFDPVKTERERPEGEEDIEGLPWHHAQLVMLYGRKVADDIVHPKMEQKQRVPINPKLFKEGPKGVQQLWGLLRDDSNGKLLKADRRIPQGFKDSYAAFVRQLVLQKGEVPVKRNFYEHDDVPDMDHLVDRKRLMHALDLRHKIELMGRSSKINQDKANILLYNNPMPDLVNASGQDSIDRYLPSWVEQEAESEASYRKWLGDKKSVVPVVKPSDSLIDLVRPMSRDSSRHVAPPKVTFLTEAESISTCKGRFSEKFKEKRDHESSVTNPADLRTGIEMDEIDIKPFRGDKARTSSAVDVKTNKKLKPKSTWEPLTLNALIEYSDKRETQGEGKFLNGMVKMYPIT